jgi:uncharacterized protein YndB with AHSA1/START domain
MKIALVVLGIVAALVLLVVLIGWSLPVAHRASRQATYAASPDAVYAAITRAEEFPQWRSKVESVEIVPSATGARSYRESGGDGPILYVVDKEVAGRQLVTRIADRSLPFGGRWTFDITPAAGGATLRITEDGEVYNPVFRFVSRFVFGHHATIDAYLEDLGKKLGRAAPSGGG